MTKPKFSLNNMNLLHYLKPFETSEISSYYKNCQKLFEMFVKC